ncbi:prolyl oligopeptidase family serine peptidase [Microtetraspora sp. NBRC 13810]|uniref:prolyl oligopeptidase family serine peptidase n=1 Tax=Microtetraspora sp. NBRC 13810 TaxID=3030990 RepID=UPI0025539992|nr:prolyl oligopeptidase family serine peptidase [Microtetraspora sp. NBRC 13810]
MYPAARRGDVVDRIHGVDVADPYRWLEDPDDPAVKEWQDAQADLFLEHAKDLRGRERFRDRLSELQRIGFVGPPSWHGDRYFFMRRTAEQEHMVLYVVEPDGTERTLLDPLAIDPSGRTLIDAWQPSVSGDLLAYQLSTGGHEESLLRVLDVATGEVVDGPIDRCRSSLIAWLPDGETFYYVRRLPPEKVPAGEERYHRRVYLHRVGTGADEDVLIFGAGRDKAAHYRVQVTGGGRWLTVSVAKGASTANDLWIADLSASSPEEPELRPVQEGVDAHTAVRVGRDGRAYIMTDREAPRGRIAVADPADLRYETWRDLIPQDERAVLADFAILDGLDRPELVLSRTRHAVAELTRHDLRSGARTGVVPTPGLGTVGGLATRQEGGHELWFLYTDTTTPVGVRRYDGRSRRTSVWARPPGVAAPPRVESRAVAFRSQDGTTVRMLVLARPGATGPRPCVLSGYGGFGVSMVPAFNPQALAWVEAGGVYAVAQVRGGGEEGEEWHRAGMRGHKQNVFDDFHAAAEKLVADGWTSPGQLAVTGGSNGGLLVGAAVTQRPDLFAAAVCSSPLLDMVRYERSGLGAVWSAEYGTASDPEQFGWLYGYSPYHRVRSGVDYPATLFTVADADTRVDPFHARKMCAALQWASQDRAAHGQAAPVLFKAESEVGHGARAVRAGVELDADILAFCATHTGLDPTGG